MTKLDFLLQLHSKLEKLPQDELEEQLNFYSEMIDDRMEEGLSEEDAIAAIGTVDELAAQILADTPIISIIKANAKAKKLRAWEIVLLILGSPLWLSLLISGSAVIVCLYISLWAIVISLWASFVSIIICAFATAVLAFFFLINQNTITGIVSISGCLVCAGLSVFLFFGCKAATKGTALLAKKCILGFKNRFAKKEVV